MAFYIGDLSCHYAYIYLFIRSQAFDFVPIRYELTHEAGFQVPQTDAAVEPGTGLIKNWQSCTPKPAMSRGKTLL